MDDKIRYEDINYINIDDFKIIDILRDRNLDYNFDTTIDYKRLQNSIEKYGVMTPLVFARVDNKILELISGRRRLKAIKILKIQTIPVRIISKDTLRDLVYLYAFCENNIKDELQLYQQVISILNIIRNHSDYENNIKNFDFNPDNVFFLYEIVKNIVKKQKTKKELSYQENVILNIIRQISKNINLEPVKLMNKLIYCQIDQNDAVLLSNNFGINFQMLRNYRSKNETLEILEDVKSVLSYCNLDSIEAYNNLKDIGSKYNIKLSDFYKIENIDNNYDEKTISDFKKKNKKEFIKFKSDITKKIIEKLKEKYAEVSKKSDFEITKSNTKKEFIKFIKNADESQLQQIIDFLKQNQTATDKAENND